MTTREMGTKQQDTFLTREQLERIAARVLEDVEITNSRGLRTLRHIEIFQRRFIRAILRYQESLRSPDSDEDE